MQMGKKRKLAILGVGGLIAVLAIAAIIVFVLPDKKPEKLDTSGALLSVTQNGDTIVFYPDNTYAIQGDVEIQDVTFDYEMKSTYKVEKGKLTLEDAAPSISVASKLGDFEVAGDIYSKIEKGALVIHLEGSNDTASFELAHFELGKEQAEKIGVEGVTADSWEDGKTKKKKDDEKAEKKKEVKKEGELLSVESAGNKISFYSDNTFHLDASYISSGDGLTVDFDVEIKDKYSVEDGKLVLPANTTSIWNADIAREYGKVDVEGPARCTSDIVDGLLELHFYATTNAEEAEIAVFKIGKDDAEKIGVKGVTGDTVIEEKKAEMANGSAGGGSNNAPAQPSIAGDAKPISFSSGGYNITFYSNGQYKESGSVNANGQMVNVNVTDTYTINNSGELSISTGNQVACYVSFQGQSLSFGAPNQTSCSAQGGGYLVSFNVLANGQNYHVGSVSLSSNDIKRIQDNMGVKGIEPTPTPTPTPVPTPTPKPDPTPTDKNIIKLVSESGIDLSLNTKDNSFDISGKTVYNGMELASYSLAKPAKYSIKNNILTFDLATIKITALNPLAESMEGDVDVQIIAEKGENESLKITLPFGQDPIIYTMTKQQAESLGLDMANYGEGTTTDEDTIKLTSEAGIILTLNKKNNNFDISGKTVYNGIEFVEYSLLNPARYSVANNILIFDLATIKITALNPLAESMAGNVEVQIIVEKGENESLKITLPFGQDPIIYTMTKQQAESLGLDMTNYGGDKPEPMSPYTPDDTKTVAASEIEKTKEPISPYTPDDTKTVISFDKDKETFTIGGSGKFVVNGMEADLVFNMSDTYAMADGIVTAVNTADALLYTVTYMGAPLMQDAKAKPETTIVKDGENYKITLKTTVNNQTFILATGTVVASDIEKSEEPATALAIDTSEAVISTSEESTPASEPTKAEPMDIISTESESVVEVVSEPTEGDSSVDSSVEASENPENSEETVEGI